MRIGAPPDLAALGHPPHTSWGRDRNHFYRLLCQIRMRPTAARPAPYPAHCSCLIMKLEAGHVIMPVPWPIHKTPSASAMRPRTSNNVRMETPPLTFDLAVFTDEEKARHQGLRNDRPEGIKQKAPDDAGAFRIQMLVRSVFRHHWAAPVKTVDQRGA